jgi:protein SCO1/2
MLRLTVLPNVGRSCTVVALLAISLLGCGRAVSPGGTRRFTIVGTVADRDAIHSQLTIAHEAVAGLMPAMTMPFRIANLNPSINLGDTVKGTLVVTQDEEWIENLVITRKSDHPVSAPPKPEARASGDEVPDFQLTNQDGKPITLRTFRGQTVILTFIYTRCPFPDFCPLMMKNFNAVKSELARDPAVARQVHMLSISIDPDYDTPAVLRSYGEKMIRGKRPFENWDLATATPAQIGRMASWFGLTYSYESGQITHSLVTAVVGPNGRLVRVLPSNSWRPEELVATVSAIK